MFSSLIQIRIVENDLSQIYNSYAWADHLIFVRDRKVFSKGFEFSIQQQDDLEKFWICKIVPTAKCCNSSAVRLKAR